MSAGTPLARDRRDGVSPGEDDIISVEDRNVVDLETKIRNYNPATSRPKLDRLIKSETVKDEDEDEGTQDMAAFQAWDREAEEEQEAFKVIGEIIDLTGDVDEPPPRPSATQQARRPSPLRFTIDPGVQTLTKGTIETPNLDEPLKIGSFYEIRPVSKYVNVTFIRVTGFRKYPGGAPWIAMGIPHARTRALLGQLPRKMNEVFALYETVDENPRPLEEQALIEVPVGNVLRRRHFHVTNAPYPAHRYDPSLFSTTEDIERNGPLICRWRYIVRFHTFVTRVEGKPCEWEIRRITAAEVEKTRFRVDEETLRHDWRGPTYRGGSHKARGMTVSGRGPDDPAPQQGAGARRKRAVGQRYTLFDAFCGAGGASRGAERAGVEVRYGVDMWERAAASWRMNFPRAHMFEMDVSDFMISARDEHIRVDCLHLSPPCQVWSPAHTIPGQHDERNIMALFACRTLTEKVRPRIITLEQTFGILNPVFKMYFDALVLGFTEQGYSIGWKVVNCAAYGLPQRRTRLVMMAACPGEELPGFPPPTHSSTGENGLQKYTSVIQALSKVTGDVARNDPHHVIKYKRAPREAVIGDPHQILPRCMTTSGGQNYHYSGERCYTNREFACLQGFPVWHKFSGSYVKKQIGNAFPPTVVQALYEHISKYLHRRDGFDGDWRPRLPLRDAVDVENLQSRGGGARGGFGGRAGDPSLLSSGGSMANAIEIGDHDDSDGDVQMIDRPVSRASSRTLSGDDDDIIIMG